MAGHSYVEELLSRNAALERRIAELEQLVDFLLAKAEDSRSLVDGSTEPD